MTVRFWPMKRGCIVTSPFGPRDGGFHTGVDFGWPDGSAGLPVYAIQSGTVIHAGAADGYGGPDPAGWLVVDSTDAEGGGCLEYGHIIREVKLGQHVTAGQRIGRINPDKRTNAGVDPHLHVSAMPREYNPGAKQDVLPWLKGARYLGDAPTSSISPTGQSSKGGPVMGKPEFTELDRMCNSRSPRWGARVTNFLLHTQEGNGTAESLAAYLSNPGNGASYHYTLRGGIVCDVVDTDYASWSVLDANGSTINLCFAGSRADWSRAQWMAIEADLRIAAWLAVRDAGNYGFATDVIAPPYRRAAGISDHKYVTECLGIGTHTDVGWNFPWAVFESHVREFASGVPAAPPPNAIDQIAAASPWLGARVTQGEKPCPDNRGRFAQFANGYVYWTPTTGARPIPMPIFETWAALGYEKGPLGYPVNYHTVLPTAGEPKVGDVQAFERGVIYRRYGEPGYWVHDAIGARYRVDGFETGRWGWPTSNETSFKGGAYQDFTGGRITWSADGTLGLLPIDGADEIVPATTH